MAILEDILRATPNFTEHVSSLGRVLHVVETTSGDAEFVGLASTGGAWADDPAYQAVGLDGNSLFSRFVSSDPVSVVQSGNAIVLSDGTQAPSVRNSISMPVQSAAAAVKSVLRSMYGPNAGTTEFEALLKNSAGAVDVVLHNGAAVTTGRIANVSTNAVAKAFAAAISKAMGLKMRESGHLFACTNRGASWSSEGNATPWDSLMDTVGVDPTGPCIVIGTYSGSYSTSGNYFYGLRIPVEYVGYPGTYCELMDLLTAAPKLAPTPDTYRPVRLILDSRYGTLAQLGAHKYARPYTRWGLLTSPLMGQPAASAASAAAYAGAISDGMSSLLPCFWATSLRHPSLRATNVVATHGMRAVTIENVEHSIEVYTYRAQHLTRYGIADRSWYSSWLATGFGVKTPLSGDRFENALAKWTINGALAIVRYSSPVGTPIDAVSRTRVAQDYAAAREDACEANDFMEQPFNEHYTWGQIDAKVAAHMGQHVSLYGTSSVFAVSQAGVVKVPAAAIVAPTATNPSWIVAGVAATVGAAMDAYVAGGTGVSSSAFVAVGAITSLEAIALDEARAAYLASTISDTVVPGAGTDAYSFAVPARSMNGFPDVLLLDSQSAYKAVVCSTLYERTGDAVLAIDDVYCESVEQAL